MLSILAESLGNVWSFPFEDAFIIWLQSLGKEGTFIYYFMQFFTLFGEELFIVALLGFVYWCLDKKRGERLGIMLLCTSTLNEMTKNIVKRCRPFNANPQIENLKDVSSFSFPSGHSSSASASFVGTAHIFRDKKQKWLWILAIVMPLLVALSRNYLGAHYLTDVVAGLALGVGVVFLLDWLLNVAKNKYYVYFGILAIGLSGFFFAETEHYFTNYGLILGFVMGILYEGKFSNFQNTKVWWRMILRLVGGTAIFLGTNVVLKAIVGAIYPTYEDAVWFERIFRTLRYAINAFLLVGPYTQLFGVCDKLYKKLGWIK